jgi:hypothetical protein
VVIALRVRPGVVIALRVRQRGWLSRATRVLAALVFGLGALVWTSGAAAGPAVSATTPFPYAATNPCTGEPFTGVGTLHLLVSENVSPSGMLQSHFEARLDGLQAMTMTGKRYVVQDTGAHSFGFDTTDGAPAHETFETTAHFVRQGEDGGFLFGDDFYERFFAHITANANGDVTALDVDTETTCR